MPSMQYHQLVLEHLQLGGDESDQKFLFMGVLEGRERGRGEERGGRGGRGKERGRGREKRKLVTVCICCD